MAIRQSGKTQAVVAEAAMTTSSRLSRLMRCEDRLPLAKGELLFALSDKLWVSIGWLWGRGEPVHQVIEMDASEVELETDDERHGCQDSR